jgi:hypothetical protein
VHDVERAIRVTVLTHVQIRGKAAQFGRGPPAEVTQRVGNQFGGHLVFGLLLAAALGEEWSHDTDLPVCRRLPIDSMAQGS